MKNKVLNGVLYNTSGMMIYLFAQWFITLIVVWLGNYEMAGNLSLAMSVSATFAVIASYSMRSFQSSDIDNKFDEQVYFQSRLLTSVIALILTIIYTLFNHFKLIQVLCINIFMLYKISDSILDVMQGSLQKKWRFDIIAKSLFARALLLICSFTVSLIIFKNLFLSILIMTIVIYLFLVIYEYKKYMEICCDKKINNFDWHNIALLLKKCLPLVIYGFIINYIAMYPRVYLEKNMGTELLGYYATVAAPAVIIQAAANMIYNPIIPVYASYYKNKNKKIVSSFLKISFYLICFCILGIIFSIFAKDFLFNMLYGSAILNYTYLFYGVIVVTTLCALVWFYNMILVVFEKQKFILLSSIVGLLLVFGITPFFIDSYGLKGINYTLYVAYIFLIILYLIVIFITTRDFKREEDVKNV